MEFSFSALAQENIASYSWNPKLENRLLVATPRGNLKETTVYERIALVRTTLYKEHISQHIFGSLCLLVTLNMIHIVNEGVVCKMKSTLLL